MDRDGRRSIASVVPLVAVLAAAGCDAEPDVCVICAPLPPLLSQTGLADPGVEEFEPRFELWSDGATKRRWIRLPPGTSIDDSDPDYWRYPVGTKLWKEFSTDGLRLETRLIVKVDDTADGWEMGAYVWSASQEDAALAPDGAADVLGTMHDVPSQTHCRNCHGRMPDKVLGYTAMQLDPSLGLPGDAVARGALGYLHANCGSCHHPESDVRVDLDLLLRVELLTTVTNTPTYTSTVNVPSTSAEDEGRVRVSPGSPQDSVVNLRMELRGPEEAMPPIGSEVVDDEGVETVSAWIVSLGAL